MNAREHALRIATLEALADAVAAEYAKARAEAEPVFAAKYADEGNDRQAVLLPSGEKVGQLTIKAPSPVVDMPEGGLLEWCHEHFPAAVEEYIDPGQGVQRRCDRRGAGQAPRLHQGQGPSRRQSRPSPRRS